MAATSSRESILESKDLENLSHSAEEESSQLKTKVKPESHDDNIKPHAITQEPDRKILPSSQEEQTNNIDTSNPFIMYTQYWQHIMSNWFNTYDEFLKNLMKMNGFWFGKS